MKHHVASYALNPQRKAEIIEWCKTHYKDVVRINSPSLAELHRVSFDDRVNGILVIFFREDKDYSFFLLRWS